MIDGDAGTLAWLNHEAPASASAEAGRSFELRLASQWDNPDGSIERGYGGRSVFFPWEAEDAEDGERAVRRERYARLLAEAGFNGVILNNVNTTTLGDAGACSHRRD